MAFDSWKGRLKTGSTSAFAHRQIRFSVRITSASPYEVKPASKKFKFDGPNACYNAIDPHDCLPQIKPQITKWLACCTVLLCVGDDLSALTKFVANDTANSEKHICRKYL
jgi:hypothetical protein